MNQYVKPEQDDQMFLVVAQMKNTCNENELLYFNASPVYKFRLFDTYLSSKTKKKNCLQLSIWSTNSSFVWVLPYNNSTFFNCSSEEVEILLICAIICQQKAMLYDLKVFTSKLH